MKLTRYLVEAELNGKPIRKIWRADHPLKIGHPEVWHLERTDGGIKVTKYHDHRPLLPNGERSAEFEKELELTQDTLVRPFVVKADEQTRIHKLSIVPAHSITPVFQGRLPGERTRAVSVPGEGKLEGEEFFVFTCLGNWVASSEVLETGLLRPDWVAYFAGRHAFKVRKLNDQKYVLRCLVPRLDLKFESHEYPMTKDQVLELTPAQLNTIEVRLGDATWYFRKVRKAGQLPQEFQSVDESTELFRKLSLRFGAAFALLLAGVVLFYQPKVVAPPTPPIEVEFKRETILVPKPIEPPKQEIMPEPPKPEPPKPEPKPEPVKPQPAPPKPQAAKPPKPQPARLPPPPAPAPARPQAAAPPPAKTAIAEKAPAPEAPVTQAPPPPTAAQIQAAEVAKALSALGASNRPALKVPTPNQYAKPGANYSPSNAAAGATSSKPSQISEIASQDASVGAVTTSGSRSIRGGAVSGRDLAGGKGLNDVQGRVASNSVYKGAATLGGGTGQGMSVGGQGHLDPAAIRKVLEANQNRIQYCYEKTLLSNPSAAGVMTIGWQVRADGSVADVQVIKSQIADSALQGCVSQVLKSLRFPKPQGGAVQVEYPFQFTSSSI